MIDSSKNIYQSLKKMGTNKTIDKIEADQLKKYPEFSSGDTVEVSVRVKEGKRERVQLYEGVVIAKKNRGLSSSFTVRKISYGEGVERVEGVGHNSILATDLVKKGESLFNSPRVTFERGDLLGETPSEIIKNTKIDKTKSEAPTVKKTTEIKKSDNDQLNMFFDNLGDKCD